MVGPWSLPGGCPSGKRLHAAVILLDSPAIMTNKRFSGPASALNCPGLRPARLLMPALGAALAAAFWPGCTRTEDEAPPARLQAVEAYGLTLDESATPQEVAFVLLRSLADDVKAAQARPPRPNDQKAAMRLTYSLAAYQEIANRILQVANQNRSPEKADLGPERGKKLFSFTKQWAPIVAHYVNSFDTDLEAAARKMWVLMSVDGQSAHVHYNAAHDPSEKDPSKRQTATIDVELVKAAAGARSFWRISRVDYLGRPSTRARIVEAFGLRLDETATPQQVAYVLLRSLAEQARLARGGARSERKAAAMLTFSLAAHAAIESRLLARINQDNPPNQKVQTLGPEPQSELLRAVNKWAPRLAEHLQPFDSSLQEAVNRMKVEPEPDGRTAHLYYQVPPDQSETEPGRRQRVTLDIELVKSQVGGKVFWRVAEVGYRGPTESKPAASATPPAPAAPGREE